MGMKYGVMLCGRTYKNRVLGRIFGPNRVKSQEAGENYTIKSSIICTLHKILGSSNQGR
jgi:hypothetical protein